MTDKICYAYRHVPDRLFSMHNPKSWRATNPGWPDPTQWIGNLVSELEARAIVYEREPDILLQRNKAGGMLATVLFALQHLPPFQKGAGHMPLKDLLIFLQDLDQGRKHPWAAPVNFGGQNVVPMAAQEMRQWAIAGAHILWGTGLGKKQTYLELAAMLTESGRPVPWRTVQTWYRQQTAPLETVIGKRIAGWWQTAPCPHGELVTNCSHGHWAYALCPHASDAARELIKSCLDLPNLRDRIKS
jgi:hypothetical protein